MSHWIFSISSKRWEDKIPTGNTNNLEHLWDIGLIQNRSKSKNKLVCAKVQLVSMYFWKFKHSNHKLNSLNFKYFFHFYLKQSVLRRCISYPEFGFYKTYFSCFQCSHVCSIFIFQRELSLQFIVPYTLYIKSTWMVFPRNLEFLRTSLKCNFFEIHFIISLIHNME